MAVDLDLGGVAAAEPAVDQEEAALADALVGRDADEVHGVVDVEAGLQHVLVGEVGRLELDQHRALGALDRIVEGRVNRNDQ